MSLEQLVELQGIDTQLKDLSDLLGDLPSKVQGLNEQEDAIKNSLVENKKRLKELDVELHKRELDVLLSSGEQVTCALLTAALIKMKLKAKVSARIAGKM